MRGKKKWSHFDLKSWVTGGTKIRPGIPSNWRIFESNWLDIESQFWNQLSTSSQFYSNILQLLEIPGRILVPPVTQLFRSKWLHFFCLCGDTAAFMYTRVYAAHDSQYVCIYRTFMSTSVTKKKKTLIRGYILAAGEGVKLMIGKHRESLIFSVCFIKLDFWSKEQFYWRKGYTKWIVHSVGVIFSSISDTLNLFYIHL